MKIRYLSESDVSEIVPLEILPDVMETAFRDHATGVARDTARQRTHMPEGTLHVLQAASSGIDRIGFKSYFPGRTHRTFHVKLMELSTGCLLGLVEADELGIRRTGAATAVATRALAREDASVLACFGTGRHAVTQARSVAGARTLREIRVFGRNQERLDNFCREVSASTGLIPIVADNRDRAMKGADIVNIVTRSPTPLFDGRSVEPGMHINAVGSNALSRREIDLETIRLCDVIVVDSVEVARIECGDLLPAADKGLLDWHTTTELGQVLAGIRPGRTSPEQVTLFESQGMGLLDLYAANLAFDRAAEAGAGKLLEFG